MKFNQRFNLPALSISVAATLLLSSTVYAAPETAPPTARPLAHASTARLTAAEASFPETLALDMAPARPPLEAQDCGRQGHPGGRFGEDGRGGMGRQLEALKMSLNLNSQQAARWENAKKAMMPAPEASEAIKARMEARHDQVLAALSDPAFNPRKFAAEMDRNQAEMQTRFEATRKLRRDAWFAVYDSLDAGQRGQVREFLRAHLERMRETFQMHHGMRHGPGMSPGDRGCSPDDLPHQS